MAKARGHRANKVNDSFGTLNNDALYKGKYRDEVYKEDDEETNVEAQDADPVEQAATQQEQGSSFVEAKKEPSEDHDYKKRYDDLKRHYDSKVLEFKGEIEELKSSVNQRNVELPQGVPMPKTMDELAQFKDQYPEVFEVVQTVSTMQTESQLSQLREELGTIKEREKELEKQTAYEQLLNAHPDFNDLKADEKFLEWLEEQPSSIADGIYKNNTDSKWAARVIDLYKADNNIGTKKQTRPKKNEDAAAAVTRQNAKEVSTRDNNGKIWKASQIAKMRPWEFEKMEAELDLARQEGRIELNS